MVTFRRRPDEEIAEAHERHAAKSGAAPPSVRNAEALVALSESRPIRWRGHRYHVPNLSFALGVRLLIVSQALAAAHHRHHKAGLRTARRLLRECVRSQRGRKLLLNPFRAISVEDARDLIDELLYVPDEAPRVGGKRQTVDLLDGLLEFARVFPALVGDDGLPVSWAHYQYGVRHLPRINARELLRTSQALRVGQWADKANWDNYAKQQSEIAGWKVN